MARRGEMYSGRPRAYRARPPNKIARPDVYGHFTGGEAESPGSSGPVGELEVLQALLSDVLST